MKYRLKDRVLHERLDFFTNGEFSKNLNSSTFTEDSFSMIFCGEEVDGVSIKFDVNGRPEKVNRMIFIIRADEVVEVPDYNPNGWNLFPDVLPPERKAMRLELVEAAVSDGPESKPEKVLRRAVDTWDGHSWGSDISYGVHEWMEGERFIRFRPWLDPEEENK